MLETISIIFGIIGFTISSYKDIDNLTPQLEKAYSKALHKWARNNGVRESYAKHYYSSLTSLKEYIISKGDDDNASELVKLFYNELKAYQTAEGFMLSSMIEGNNLLIKETLAITGEIKNDVKKIKNDTAFLVNQYKHSSVIQESTYTLPHNYIDRTARNYSAYSIEAYLHPDKYRSQELCNYIVDGIKSIILFSDAQLGKTTELNALAYNLQSSNLYFPYIFELCNYISSRSFENQIERHLYLSKRNAVLILDGLDETNSTERGTLVKEINQLRSNYPDLYIVISCRSNFKDLVNLSAFVSLYLDELGWSDARRYIDNHCQNPSGLIDSFEQNGYYEMARSPFLLIEAISYYKDKERLPCNVTAIYRRFIDRCFELDKAKMPDIVSSKTRLYSVLQRIAFCLVVSQRTHITRDELYEDLRIPIDDIELCLKLSIMSSNEDGLKFIHNSFKEFITAESLSELPFEKLQCTICYEGSSKMRPSMYNTTMLLLGVVDYSNPIYNPLKTWLLDDYKELLVNAGGEFLNEDQRDNILQAVYNDHKVKGLWLEYGFSQSLMLFANTHKSIMYLLSHIISAKEPAAYLYNALFLLHYANFNLLSQSEFLDASKLLLEILEKYKSDRKVCDHTIKPIENISFLSYDRNIIKEVFRIIKNTKYHNLINMFCTIASNCDLCDEYANWVFEKSKYVRNYSENGTSYFVSNSDLVKFLTKLKKPENIVKAAEYVLMATGHAIFEKANSSIIFENLKSYTKDKDAVLEQIIEFVCAKDKYNLTAKYIDNYRNYIADNYDLPALFAEYYHDIKQLFTENSNYSDQQQQVVFNKFTLFVTCQGIDIITKDDTINEQKKSYILNYLLSELMISPNDAQFRILNYLEKYDQERITRKRAEQDAFDLLFNVEQLQKQVKEAISGYATILLHPWEERAKFMRSCNNKTICDFVNECVDGDRTKVDTKDITKNLSDADYCLRFSLSYIPLQHSHVKVDINISQEQRYILENMVLWSFENVDLRQGCTRLSQLIIDYDLSISDDVILSLLPYSWQHITYHASSKNNFSNSVYMFEWIVDVVNDKSKLNRAIEELITSDKIDIGEHFLQIAEYILKGKQKMMYKYIDHLATKAGDYKLNVIKDVVEMGNEGIILIKKTLDQLDDNERLHYYQYLLFPKNGIFITSTKKDEIKIELESKFVQAEDASKYCTLDMLMRMGSYKALEWGLQSDTIENHWKKSSSFPSLLKYDSSNIDAIILYLNTGMQIDHSHRDSSNMFDSAKSALQAFAKDSEELRDKVVATFREVAEHKEYNYIHRIADATFDSYFENKSGVVSLCVASELYLKIVKNC